MRKAWFTISFAAIASLSLTIHIALASGIAKVELDVVPFRWIAGGEQFSSETPYYDGNEELPSSLNYKGTTYVPLRLAAQSLGYRVQWNGDTHTAVITEDNEDDPLAGEVDSSGNYPDYTFTPAIGEVPAWERKADAILQLGMSFMGTPYEFGATLGQTDTFDCSSFLNYIFGEHGIKLPRNSRQQSKLGTEIGLDQLRKGDLVFFTTPKRKNNTGVNRIGHVAIYLGDHKMLHTYRVGIGVIVSELDDRWKNRFITAKRLLD